MGPEGGPFPLFPRQGVLPGISVEAIRGIPGRSDGRRREGERHGVQIHEGHLPAQLEGVVYDLIIHDYMML